MSDIYKIGVAIMLTSNGLAPALSMMSHQLLGIHRSVAQINSGIGRWRTGLLGVAGVMGGSMILHAYAKVAEHGKEILDQQDKLARAGRTQAEVANITAAAYEKITKAVPTATAADVLRVANELTFVKGDFSKAAAAASGALKLEAIIGNATGKSAEGQGYSIWRALEEKLVTQDEGHTDKLMELMGKGIIGTGGKITGKDYFTFARRAGMSFIKADDNFVGATMPTLMNMLGADTAGTSYQTAWMSLMGTATLSKQQMETFSRLGLIDKTKAHNDHGHWNLESGAIKGSLEHQGNLADWARLVLKPALDQFPESERASILGKIGRNRNTIRMWETFTSDAGIMQIQKDAALIQGAHGLNQSYGDFIGKNPKGVEAAYDAQYKSMMGAIGAPLMTMAIPVMKAVTSMFNYIGEFASKHEHVIQALGVGFALLGGAAVVAGLAAIGAALGIGGWLAAGIVALGAVVVAAKVAWEWLTGADGPKYGGQGFSPSGADDSPDQAARGLRPLRRRSVEPPPASMSGDKVGSVYMDGRKVGAIVSGHQLASVNGPLRSSSTFDGGASMVPVGLSAVFA